MGKEYKIKELITCLSTVYVIGCPCWYQYVGRAIRRLYMRIREHIKIRKEFTKHSFSRHFREVHNMDPSVLMFYAVDMIKAH